MKTERVLAQVLRRYYSYNDEEEPKYNDGKQPIFIGCNDPCGDRLVLCDLIEIREIGENGVTTNLKTITRMIKSYDLDYADE